MVIGMKRTGQTIFSMLVGGALLLSSGTRATAEDSVVDRHEQLLRAVCLNDWDGAIALTGPLIAADKITPSYRQALVELRDQLEEFRVQGTVIPAIDNCEAVLRRYALESQVPGEPLDWAEALNSLFNDGRGAPPPHHSGRAARKCHYGGGPRPL
jgi:hypothetical protein